MTVFCVLYSPGPAWSAGLPASAQDLAHHAGYMRQLLKGGVLRCAGPYVGKDGGLAVIEAVDRPGAERIVAADPAVVQGVMRAEVVQWHVLFTRNGE